MNCPDVFTCSYAFSFGLLAHYILGAFLLKIQCSNNIDLATVGEQKKNVNQYDLYFYIKISFLVSINYMVLIKHISVYFCQWICRR